MSDLVNVMEVIDQGVKVVPTFHERGRESTIDYMFISRNLTPCMLKVGVRVLHFSDHNTLAAYFRDLASKTHITKLGFAPPGRPKTL